MAAIVKDRIDKASIPEDELRALRNKLSFCLLKEDDALASQFIKRGYSRVLSMGAADIVVFSGEEPVHPFLIGETAIYKDRSSMNPGLDKKEIKLFKSLKQDTYKIGVNRGAILLNILSGGSMYQKVDGHLMKTMPHRVVVDTSACDFRGSHKLNDFYAPSQHIQQMIPNDYASQLAFAKESKTRETDTMTDATEQHQDPEVIYNWWSNSLCCQFNPAQMDLPIARDFFFHCVDFELLGLHFRWDKQKKLAQQKSAA